MKRINLVKERLMNDSLPRISLKHPSNAVHHNRSYFQIVVDSMSFDHVLQQIFIDLLG